MSELNNSTENVTAMEDSKADLERMYIVEYLHEKGYSTQDLERLPEKEVVRLKTEASQYASLKLAALESRARLRRKIQDVSSSQ